MMMTDVDVGGDFGNRRSKVAIRWKGKILCSSVPSQYAFDEPLIVKAGQEKKIDAYPLLFRVDKGDLRLWFGNDTLASENIIAEIDQAKYSKNHLQRMLQAVLYQWSKDHGVPLSELGKLNICVSMPPGAYQRTADRKQAEKAYRNAFNTGQSHMKIRPVNGETVQIVTKFHSLVREAVVWGSDIPRRGELVLTVDLGGGTDDVVLFNGSPEPIDSKTYKTGLIRTYRKINPVNPAEVELRIFRDKNYMPFPLLTYFNEKKRLIQEILRVLPDRSDKKVYLIGGGAALIARQKTIKAEFAKLMPPRKLIVKDQFANAIANLREASR
jgi:hypothetical protein